MANAINTLRCRDRRIFTLDLFVYFFVRLFISFFLVRTRESCEAPSICKKLYSWLKKNKELKGKYLF